jgi:hypothetical protein
VDPCAASGGGHEVHVPPRFRQIPEDVPCNSWNLLGLFCNFQIIFDLFCFFVTCKNDVWVEHCKKVMLVCVFVFSVMYVLF